MIAYCRFEILLPLRYNEGRPVPREFLAETAFEIQKRFAGVSWELQVIEGVWRHQGIECRDRLNRIFVDDEDTPDQSVILRRIEGAIEVPIRSIGPLGHSSSY